MATVINRLVVFVFNNGYRTYKNTREAMQLQQAGAGHIEGQQVEVKQTKKAEHEDVTPIVKQQKKKNK